MNALHRVVGRALILGIVLSGLGSLTTDTASASTTSSEDRFVDHINRERQSRGLAALQVNTGVRSVARGWSSTMASGNNLYHNPNLADQVSNNTDGTWTRLSENVGRSKITGATWDQLVDRLHSAFMNSSGHRSNILGAYNQMGVGVTIAGDGTMWVTQVFMQGTATNVLPADSGSQTTSGSAIAISGDWDGDGRVTAGWFDNGRVLLRNEHASGAADIRFSYGRAGDVPVVGDWNGDGRDTLGVIRGRVWHLRYVNASGVADRSFVYGRLTSGDHALAGDWNGDGRDTIGIVRKGEWHLRDQLAGGSADRVFVYGRVRHGDIPVVGDWNGDGQNTPAIVRGNEWHVRDRNAGGRADKVFSYGTARDVPVVGDWNRNGRDGPGVVRGNTWYLRYELSGGSANSSFAF